MINLPSVWLVFSHTPQLGLKTAYQLAQQGDLAQLLALPPAVWRSFNLAPETIHYITQQHWPEVEADLLWGQTPGRHLITYDHPDYPPLLKEIAQPPLVLYGIGNIQLLSTPQLAIVGTRKPTPQSRENAYHFACALAKAGFTITSGLALGIDGASHEGALHADGNTIAVLGNGLNSIYPSSHQKLGQTIATKGLLLSEFSPATPPLAAHFPQRNRIISGLSLAVLVVEAALKSGSLITARFACEQGREVFAMPGSIHNPQTRGCHALIRQGAKLTETVQDILEELTPQWVTSPLLPANKSIQTPKSELLDKILENVLQYIDFSPTLLEQILARSGWPVEQVLTALTQLEIAGHISVSTDGYIRN